MIQKIAGIPLMAQPGEQWYYSIGMDIQGYIVEQLTGMRFGEYLRQHLFEPLDMKDTRFYVMPDGVRILKPESVRIMSTNSLTGKEDMRFGIGGPGQPGRRVLAHNLP
jgi:CubicO group peptidase (beta-lactamase class C family)